MLYESFQRQEKIIVRIEGSDYFRLTAALDGTFKGLRRGSELALYDLASPSQLLGLDWPAAVSRRSNVKNKAAAVQDLGAYLHSITIVIRVIATRTAANVR
ncbi:hypothetical protein AcW1_005645 [Taiwanofungus camphoratus]|nr:hypothetical protein AcW2_004410 [Antrodia cinnamomea]KAI0933975.1 hypothetical protein AcV5_005972 [Antrodia cinnamomea]KAI0957171.1 hypothetical protein AcW1_005645 [Antrodia cinnamomea]